MNLLLWVALLIVVVVLGRFWYYWREVLFIKDLNKTYGSFFHEYLKLPKGKPAYVLDPGHPALTKITKLRRRKARYVSLVKKAGFYDDAVMTHAKLGYQDYTVDYKVAELIDEIDTKYVSSVMESFDNIIGFYEDRAMESFDPYFWIKVIYHSPSYITKLIIDGIRYAFMGGK